MKVLILSISTGQGHHSAAKSISDALAKRNADIKITDVYDQTNKLLCWSVNQGYLFFTKYTKKTYRAVYNHLEYKKKLPSIKTSQNPFSNLVSLKFEKFIKEYSPDVIICTHVFAAQVVNELKRKGRFTDIPTIGIITDYTIHPFWDKVDQIEYFLIANELLTQKAIMSSIDKKKLLPFGIPIQSKFTKKVSKPQACSHLNISESKRTILVMAGSMGYGDLPKVISSILNFDNECQILAVCGNNLKLQEKLTNQHYGKNVKVFGFSNEIDLLMDASDCIITKPGGLTTTEAISKNLPMILVNPIPGQEERNMDFFVNNGVAIAATETFSIEEALYYLFENSSRIELIKKQQRELSKPSAADDLTEFIYSLKNNAT